MPEEKIMAVLSSFEMLHSNMRKSYERISANPFRKNLRLPAFANQFHQLIQPGAKDDLSTTVGTPAFLGCIACHRLILTASGSGNPHRINLIVVRKNTYDCRRTRYTPCPV